MKMRLQWVAWRVMPDCSGRPKRCSWWRRPGSVAGGGRQALLDQELVTQFTTRQQTVLEFQLGVGMGHSVGAVLIGIAVFSRVVRTSRLYRHIVMD